jgi:hypothetical protein
LPYDKTKNSVFGASNEREGEEEGREREEGECMCGREGGREMKGERKERRGEKVTEKKLKTVEMVSKQT